MTIKMEGSGPSGPTTKRRYLGNNQVITLSEVTRNVDIVGNHNTLTVNMNSALIRVVGNSCKVKVHNGSGQIRLVGDNCSVLLGDGVDASKCVKCVGNNTRISRIPREQRAGSERQTSEDAISEIGFYMSQDNNSHCKTSKNNNQASKEGSCNGLVERCDKSTPATFVHKQGYLYIDNCVRIRTNSAIKRPF